MSSEPPTARDSQLRSLIVAQAHTSALAAAAAALLAVAARRLIAVPGSVVWPVTVLLAAAGAAAVAAAAPWLTTRFTVRVQRRLLWGATAGAGLGVGAAVFTVDLLAVLAVQLLVVAAALAEAGNRRRALLWFWIVGGVLAAVVLGYHAAIDVQARPE